MLVVDITYLVFTKLLMSIESIQSIQIEEQSLRIRSSKIIAVVGTTGTHAGKDEADVVADRIKVQLCSSCRFRGKQCGGVDKAIRFVRSTENKEKSRKPVNTKIVFSTFPGVGDEDQMPFSEFRPSCIQPQHLSVSVSKPQRLVIFWL